MWTCGRLLCTSLVTISVRVACRSTFPAARQTSAFRVRAPYAMEPAPPPSTPELGREESGLCAQRKHQEEKTDGVQKKKKGQRKRKRTCSNESIGNLLHQLPFANADISAVFEIKRTAEKKVKKKSKRKPLESEDDDKSKKQKRANYFVSLPITNSKIHDDIQTIQDSVLEKDKRLSKAMISKGSYHITLFVMHLAKEEDVTLAVSALLESKKPVEDILKGMDVILTFCGLSDFKREVVFAQTTQGDAVTSLKQITETMGKIFEKKGIAVFGSKDFVPHLTLMKLSKAPKLRKQGIKKIDTSLYMDFQSHNFGEEFLQRLDLCSMLKKRQTNGYYHTEASIFFGKRYNGGNWQTALQKELKPLLDKVKDIKAVLALPETREKIYKEVFGKRLITQNNSQTLPSETKALIYIY